MRIIFCTILLILSSQITLFGAPNSPDYWARYYETKSKESPSADLKVIHWLSLQGLENPLAIDLGCGNGVDTRGLFWDGWRVLAIDSSPLGINILNTRKDITAAQREKLTTQCVSFEKMRLSPSYFINAQFSLSFCAPGHFGNVWNKIVTSLQSRGIFFGDFLGNKDSWSVNKKMTFHSREQVELLFKDFN